MKTFSIKCLLFISKQQTLLAY